MNNNIEYSNGQYIFMCPHCNTIIQVDKSQTNCKIFRHGVFKANFKQINPHLKKEICDYLVEKDLIYGCGKPFKIDIKEMKVTVCDYI